MITNKKTKKHHGIMFTATAQAALLPPGLIVVQRDVGRPQEWICHDLSEENAKWKSSPGDMGYPNW